DRPGQALAFYPGAAVVTETSPELMGVGYIIGQRISCYFFAGGCFAYLVLAPAIKLVGSGLTEPFGFPAVKLIRDMSPGDLRSSFVFYIGAGAVASAGIIALARSLPTIMSSFASSLKDLRGAGLSQTMTRPRTEDDLPISLTVGGSIALAIVLTLLPQLGVNLLGAVLIVIFGFFFATVSSRICGQIGSSANPISGMTIAALLGTCLIFVAIGWTGVDHRVQALSIAAVVAVATANAGNTSQDLMRIFGQTTPLIVKLEKGEAIENLDAILQIADGVMVARGDLGVELAPEQVPMLQKRIIHRANQRGIPVITATQMLESMIHDETPTRAEANDV